MIWFLLACTSQPEHFAAALQAGADADCSPLNAPKMKGDCLAWKARRQGEQDDLAGASVTCTSVEDPVWRAECWFLVADALGSTGQAAVTLCQRAEDFEEECLGHSTNRALMEMLDSPDQELQAMETAEATWLAFYGDPKRAREKAEVQLVTGLLRRGRPYTKRGFGTTPEPLIVQTLAGHLGRMGCTTKGLDHVSLEALLPAALELAGCPETATQSETDSPK